VGPGHTRRRSRDLRADRGLASLPHRRLAVITGISEIATAIRLRQEIRGEWALIIGGALSVLFGVILAVIGPVAGLLSLIWLIGIYALLFGVLMLITAFQVRGRDASRGPDRPSRVV
jgi:FtsH-binding integral membrane protein